MYILNFLKSVVCFASLWDVKKSVSLSYAFLFVLNNSELLKMFMLKTHLSHLDADAEKRNLV